MLQAFFHAWERQLAAATTDRVDRRFEWGLDGIPSNGSHSRRSEDLRRNSKGSPDEVLGDWIAHVMTDTDAFFTPEPTSDYTIHRPTPDSDRLLTFPSALVTPHRENNTVYCRLFPAGTAGGPRAAGRARGAGTGPPQG